MPLLGEEPITSFFKRTTTKAKENVRPIRDSAKRKHEDSKMEANSRQSKKIKVEEPDTGRCKTQYCFNKTPLRVTGRDNAMSISKTSGCGEPVEAIDLTSLPSAHRTQSRPDDGWSVKAKVDDMFSGRRLPPLACNRSTSLHTPPPTTLMRKAEKRASIRDSSPTRTIAILKPQDAYLPTPHPSVRRTHNTRTLLPNNDTGAPSRTTDLAPLLQLAKSPSPGFDIKQPSLTNALVSSGHTPHHYNKSHATASRLLDDDPFHCCLSQQAVPSSQTQDIAMSQHGIVPSSQTQILTYLPPDDRSSPVSERTIPASSSPEFKVPALLKCPSYGEQEVVSSSQTQYIYTLDSIKHVRTEATEVLQCGSSVSTQSIVATSQSCIEKELSLSMIASQLFKKEGSVVSSSGIIMKHRAQDTSEATSTEGVPADTPTVSISQAELDFDDLFEQDSNLPTVPQVHAPNHAEDSATESEYGDITFTRLVTPRAKRTYATGKSVQHISPLRGSPGSSNSGSQHADETRQAGHVVGTLDVDESSSSQLSVVRDFLDMFGDSDASYPDDFPMSLR